MENGVNGVTFCLDEQTPAEDDSSSKMSRCDSDASFKPKLESRILVLYTGGTIGMKSDKHGAYEPKSDFLVGELRNMPLFNNKLAENEDKDLLTLPMSDEQPIVYKVIEYSPLLDSSNMTMADWARIAKDIQTHYEQYDGFVVLHGTDTMAYTASALSFMCENLGKPVILTGAQIPIFEMRSDGRDNFLNSLIIAGHYSIPEVLVCFNNKILRGNRTSKLDNRGFAAFDSPNMPPLARLEITIHVDWAAVYRSSAMEKFAVHTNMCPNVGILRMFPGITSQTVRAFLQPPMQGVVLQTYGAGNAPDNRPDLLQQFKQASDWGVIIVNTSQCIRGYVSPSYATGKVLMDAGVLPGSDLTPEAALTKLSYVHSKDWSLEKKKKMMTRNLRGEMTVVMKEEISILDMELIESVSKTLHLSSKEELVKIRDALYPSLMCAAAKAGDIPTLQKLKETGGNFSCGDYDGRTPLHVAVQEGHRHVVHYLLDHGMSVHARDCHGNTPLIDAVDKKHTEIIRMLIRTGATLTYPPIRVAMEICFAASQDDLETVVAWHTAGADINVGDYDRRTPLHVAVCNYSKKVAAFLLNNGARSDLQDVFGSTALMLAEKLCYADLIELINASQKCYVAHK